MKIELNSLCGDILNNTINVEVARLYVVLNSIVYVDQALPTPIQQREMTLLFKLAPSSTGLGNEIEYCKTFESKTGSADNQQVQQHILQQVDKLQPVLDTIAVDQDEIFLITWDHGSGFGIFRQELPVPPTVATPIDNQLDRFPSLKVFWELAADQYSVKEFLSRKNQNTKLSYNLRANADLFTIAAKDIAAIDPILKGLNTLNVLDPPQPPEILMNGELARVIEKWLADPRVDKKVGVLLMLNCCMMNLHTLYSLRNVVKFLVAPQGNIDNPGYNYRDILLSIYNAPPIPLSPERLADNILCFSHNPFLFKSAKTLNKAQPDTINLRTIVNIRLDHPNTPSPIEKLITFIGGIIDQLNTLADPATDTDGSVRHLLKYAREICFNFGDRKSPLIDLPNYLSTLASISGGVNPTILKNDLTELINTLQDAVQQELPGLKTRFIGEHAYYVDYRPDPGILTGRCPTGYGIYFPRDLPLDPGVVANVINDELLKLLPNWKLLINTIYDIQLP